jgi:Tol biopolymer transport system component/regulation of enolase protein 1 (concanavalin A-like superfamily)
MKVKKREIFWSLLAIVTMTGLSAAMAQSEHLYSELDETLLTSEAPPGDSLHVMDCDGRNLRPFVSHPEYTAHGSPAWNRDGSKLAFDAWRSRRGETYVDAHIFTCSADGSQLRDLGVGAMPSWSPEGSRFVFSSYSPRGVYLMNADGTGRRLLDADGWGGEWSPTADRIAYAAYSSGRSANVAVQELDEASRTPLAPRMLLDDRYKMVFWGMAWSSDGNWIAFKAETRTGTTELAIVHVEGHEKGFRVLLPAALPDMTDLLHNPCWNPDGRQIIAAVITKANSARHLYLLDAAGKEPAKPLPGLEKDRWYNDMAWSPDGTRIVVSTRQTPAGPAVQWLNAPLEQATVPVQPMDSPILPAVPAPPTVGPAVDSLPSDARELLRRYAAERTTIQNEAEQKICARRQKLVEELRPLQDKYTREAKLDEAVAIRDLIRTLKESVENVLPDPGVLQNYMAYKGRVFHFRVTGRADGGSLWGTDVYTADSTLAMAAVHAGVLKPGGTGVVKVTILPGQSAYQGSTRNGVTSSSYGSYPCSYNVEPAGGDAGGFFYAPQRPHDQATAGGEQDPVVAELRRIGAKLVAKGARGSWSPDAKRIAVGKMPFGSGVWLVQVVGLDEDASAPRIPLVFGQPAGAVTEFLPDGKDPAWSPDGKWIAFTREVGSGAGATEEVWLTGADRVVRGKPVPVSQRRLGTGVMATWSADATTVFFSNPQTREILSLRVDKPAEPVVVWKAIGDQFPDLWYPVVAPNGRYVAYHADGRLKIADMTSQKIVGSWPLDGWRGWLGGWSSDGTRLGYGAFGGEDKGLWELSFVILGKPALSQPRRILNGSCTLPCWSADGSKVAFDVRSPQRGYEVWMVDAKHEAPTAAAPASPASVDVPPAKAAVLPREKAGGVIAVTVEVRLVALHEQFLASAGGQEGGGNLAPLGKIGGAVVLKSQQGNNLPEMDRRISTPQAPKKLALLSGVEGKIADFGGPSGELRLRPAVSEDRKSVHVELSYRYPGDPGAVTSIKENIPFGSVLAVSVGERVSTSRSENKTPILGDVPYLNRFFKSVGIGRERILFVLILTPQVVAEQQDKMPVTAWPVAAFDGFDGRLDLPWKPIRHDPTHASLDKHPGKLTIITQRGSIHADEKNDEYGGGVQAKNIFVIGNPLCNGEDFAMTTCVENFTPQTPYQQAGLICYDDDDNYLKFGYEFCWPKGAGHTFTCVREINKKSNFDVAEAKPGIKKYWLRIIKRSNKYEYAYSYDGETYVTVGEQTWGDGRPKKLGVLAKNGGNPDAPELECQFDFFQLTCPNEEKSINWDRGGGKGSDGAPKGDKAGTLRPIKLGPKANQELKKSFNEDGLDNSLAELPQGRQELGGVTFEIGPGCIRLRGNQRPKLPQAVEGIPVGFCLDKLHLLHATEFGAFGDESHPFFVKDGTHIGDYKIHYADGSTATIPIVYGEDVRDWWYWEKSKDKSLTGTVFTVPVGVKRGKVAWTGKNADAGQYDVPLRLYLTNWDNPKPNVRVTTIDYVSVGQTAAGPFCVAITAHTAETGTDPSPAASSAKEESPVVTAYHLKHASAEAIAKELTTSFAGQNNCRFATDARKNVVIAFGTAEQQKKIQEAIRSRDVPGTPLGRDVEEGMMIDAIEDNLPDSRSP